MTTEDLKPSSFIDDLIANYSPLVDTFAVELPKGERITFRTISDYDDLKAFQVGADEFLATLEKPSVKQMWAAFLPKGRNGALAAYTLSTLSVEPKLSPEDACKMLRCAWVVALIVERFEESRMAFLARTVEGIEEEKKD